MRAVESVEKLRGGLTLLGEHVDRGGEGACRAGGVCSWLRMCSSGIHRLPAVLHRVVNETS